jgi:hypothetical protein
MRGRPVSGQALLRTSQPRKTCVQHDDAFRGGYWGRRGGRDGIRWRREKRAPSDPLVAAVRSAATRSQEAQLLGGFIKEDIRVLGHGVFRTPHSLALVWDTSKFEKRSPGARLLDVGRASLRALSALVPTSASVQI